MSFRPSTFEPGKPGARNDTAGLFDGAVAIDLPIESRSSRCESAWRNLMLLNGFFELSKKK